MTASQQTLLTKVKRINAEDAVVTLTKEVLDNYAYENDLTGASYRPMLPTNEYKIGKKVKVS